MAEYEPAERSTVARPATAHRQVLAVALRSELDESITQFNGPQSRGHHNTSVVVTPGVRKARITSPTCCLHREMSTRPMSLVARPDGEVVVRWVRVSLAAVRWGETRAPAASTTYGVYMHDRRRERNATNVGDSDGTQPSQKIQIYVSYIKYWHQVASTTDATVEFLVPGAGFSFANFPLRLVPSAGTPRDLRASGRAT